MSFIKKLTISTKLAISYLLIGVVTLLTVSFALYYIFKKTIIEKTTNQLVAVNVIKEKSIENFFFRIIRDVRDDEYQLSNFYTIQNLHIINNAPAFNSNDSLLNSSRSSVYEDVVFIDSTGTVLKHASASKFLDDSVLKIIQQQLLVKRITNANNISFIDITNQYGVKHAQMICAFKLKTRSVWGIYFINQSHINDLVEIRSGMGNTGESYLVGHDLYMRSRSRFLQNTLPSNIQVKTQATSDALAGKGFSRGAIMKDYRGIDVINVYSKINVPGIDWVLISEIDVNEAMASVLTIRNYMITVAMLISIVLMFVTLVLVRRIVNPINNLTVLIDDISLGKFNQPFQKQNFSEDEIGKVEDAIINLQQRISATASFADEIGKGNLAANYNTLSNEDTLGNALLKMRADLIDIKRKEKLLTKQKTSALIEGQEKERERLARELHDGLGQMLTAIRLRIGLLKEDTQSKKDIQQIIDDTIQELRRISNNVMPAVLIDFGLEAGLKSLVDYSTRLYHLPVSLSYKSFLTERKPLYNFDINVSLYRIAQEAINNAIKYSNTSEVFVKVIENNNQIEMSIRDNGIGFDVQQKSSGKGLGNMRERAKLIDGKFYIESSTKGTSISIFVPLNS